MRFIIFSLFVVACFLSCKPNATETAEQVESKRPNILFIMADDHAFQAISAYGHPVSQLAPTPNIDRLAKEGALFQSNFCTNSICGPSRAVILTGKHSHINGFRMNGEQFDGSQVTFPKLLQKSDYQTAIVGKWHLHGLPEGFDYWHIIRDQGNYYNPEFISMSDSTASSDTSIIEGYATDIITADAIDYLENKRNPDQPFMLMVHHKAPHRNWMPALRHANAFDSIQFPVPETFFPSNEGQQAAQEQLQTIYRDMYEGHDLKMTKEKGSPELAHNPWTSDFDRMTVAQREAWDQAYQAKNDAMHDANLQGAELATYKYQRYMQDYLACIKSVDEGVGKILDYLDANGLSENTLVVYTSDQGFYLGEHGWFDKRFMYEESLRMPLLMRFPGAIPAGIEIDALTQNLDFAESFLDYANVEIPKNMQGQSLKPLFERTVKDADFRNAIYYHYYDFPAFHMVKKQYGVRTDRYKLIHFYDDIDVWEMYDLQKDPHEIKNIIGQADYADIEKLLHHKLDSLQQVYLVTDQEFEQASAESVEKNYKNFEKLRGNTGEQYTPTK